MNNDNLFICDFCGSDNLIEVHYGLFRCRECDEYTSFAEDTNVEDFQEAKKHRRFRADE
jgi:predicted ATP-dependent serine protease